MALIRPCTLAALALAGLPAARGQNAAAPDDVVTLNDGIYEYLRGVSEREEARLTTAVERFTAVLTSDSGNRSALLFRALSRGRLALFVRNDKMSERNTADDFDEVIRLRQNAKHLEQFRQELAEAETLDADASANPAEKAVAAAQVAQYRRLLRQFDMAKDKSVAQLQADRTGAMKRFYGFADRERSLYREMLTDLGEAIRLSDQPEAVVQLVDVVARANAARIDEQEALGVVRGDLSPDEASGPVDALRAASAGRLEQAATVLQELLQVETDPTVVMRTKFFLGVIRYRQGVPLRDEKRERTQVGAVAKSLLLEAEQAMTELADDPQAPTNWGSFGALYLGLILPYRAASEMDSAVRDRLLDDAEARLKQAAALSLQATKKDEESIIPHLVWRQRKLIADLRARPAAAAPRNDLSLRLYAGARYDTNVVLLGERTDLPRDISREKDYGATVAATIDHTLDLSDRLTLGWEARTAQLWNVDVDEFDQQSYGGSVALQYQLIAESNGSGPTLLALQYDYDYSLLGREGFLSASGITPSVRVHWAERRAQTDVFFNYQIRNYFEPLFDGRFNRDGNYLKLGVAQRVKLVEMTELYEQWGWQPWGHAGDAELAQDDPDYPKRYLSPFVVGTYSWDSTDGDEFDRTAVGLATGFELPLPWGWGLDASASFEWEEYSHGSLVDFHRRQRDDLVQEYGLALSRTFVLAAGDRANRYVPAMDRTLMTIRAHATWTEDDSNVVDRVGQAVFSYDRAVYGISVAFTIN